MLNKKGLSLLLSKLQAFKDPKIKLEQYSTPSEIAADILWKIFMDGNIQGKIIADLGCGTGILGIGALILGAKKVFFVDIDKKAIDLAKQNKALIEKLIGTKFPSSFLNKDIAEFDKKADIVIENPPFGVKAIHSDRAFLTQAIKIADTIYSFHKSSTERFVEAFCRDNFLIATKVAEYSFPLPKIFWFHTKKVSYTKVGVWHIINNHKI